MKTIGIVGGLAWPSTITYYKLINEEIAKRLGGDGLHCAKLFLPRRILKRLRTIRHAGTGSGSARFWPSRPTG